MEQSSTHRAKAAVSLPEDHPEGAQAPFSFARHFFGQTMAKPANLIEALTLQMNPGLSLDELRHPRVVTDKPNPPPSKKSKLVAKAKRKAGSRR